MKADTPISMEPVPRFPVNYPRFISMAEVGDTIFIGRYLVRLLLSLATFPCSLLPVDGDAAQGLYRPSHTAHHNFPQTFQRTGT